MPRYSIVVPAYNAESTLAKTLDAVHSQSYDDWECLVVNDGSTDSTEVIAQSYEASDARYRLITQENLGSAGAYNTGVKAARGEFVVLCSADDVLFENHLEVMTAFAETEPGYDIYSSNGYFWHPGASRELVYPLGTRDEVQSLSLADVIRVCFYSVGAIYRREWHDRIAGYREDVFGEDYDFWLRAMASGASHRYLPQALSLHRVSPTQKSANLERAYRSDIRLVTDLARDFQLSEDEIAAVEDCVTERERLIGALSDASKGGRIRHAVFRAACALLGETRARRLIARVKGQGEVGPDA